ncbi:hypothetical protein WEN_03105 [Mycoplasma wenyonii str. Massachusetts]|uniref:Uncharacterized protein n=1 Tax=Mycoplasma wenyonii (strain Massachusetts) TaxID=1197325 RepID=I6ZFK6_MYCWM|nr:hypothetical protein [Mycoplasma wenyonii]AFN65402.1 hypothetical protein WEN_03105 [Mycoplasma wenyonii str. Massachusetts]
MDQMVKILEEELGSAGKQIDIGCFAVSGDRMTLKRPSLFVCTNLASTDLVTFWFHYNWNNRTKTTQRVNQVTSMSYQSSRRVSLHFKSGGFGNLTTFDEIPDWLKRWRGKPFDTKTTCLIKKEGSNDSYTLTCPSSDQKPFTQTIKSSDFHRPKTLSLG